MKICRMFMSSCKKLRIMKGSEAKGLGCGSVWKKKKGGRKGMRGLPNCSLFYDDHRKSCEVHHNRRGFAGGENRQPPRRWSDQIWSHVNFFMKNQILIFWERERGDDDQESRPIKNKRIKFFFWWLYSYLFLWGWCNWSR